MIRHAGGTSSGIGPINRRSRVTVKTDIEFRNQDRLILEQRHPYRATARCQAGNGNCWAIWSSDATPRHHRDAARLIENPGRSGLKPCLLQQLFRRSRRHIGKHGPPARQCDARRPRQMEKMIAGEKQSEDVGAADDGDVAVIDIEVAQGFFDGSACRIP